VVRFRQYFFFFFKQKTAYEIVDCDWSSDVCSSDLEHARYETLAARIELFKAMGGGWKKE